MRQRHNDPENGPVIVGVDGSARSVDALALADLLGPALGPEVLIAYVHPYGELEGLLSGGEYETRVQEVAQATFLQVREHLPSVPERRMRLVSDKSPAALLARESDDLDLLVVGSRGY